MSDTETFLIVSEDGDVLDSVSGPHVYPFPFNRALRRATELAAEHGILYIDDSHGRRWGRIERIEDWCLSWCPSYRGDGHE